MHEQSPERTIIKGVTKLRSPRSPFDVLVLGTFREANGNRRGFVSRILKDGTLDKEVLEIGNATLLYTGGIDRLSRLVIPENAVVREGHVEFEVPSADEWGDEY